MLPFNLLHGAGEIDKKFCVLFRALTGETQFRAKRTRIKILRAIADRNGIAGFSDIKGSTGLSTGSIYYHLERMPNYVTKDSKHYLITEQGLRLLRDMDPAYAKSRPAPRKEEEIRDLTSHQSKPPVSHDMEPTTQDHATRTRLLVFGGISAAAIVMIMLSVTGFFSLPSSVVLIPIFGLASALVYASRLRSGGVQGIGYRGLTLFAISLAIAFAAILLFSDTQVIGAPSPKSENSMDALLSSYSLHWQVR